MSNLTDFIGGSGGGLNLADIAMVNGNADVFEISDRDGTTGEVLRLIVGASFEPYKGLTTMY